MKKILTLLFLISFNLNASNEKEELREKLNKLDGFYASYYQSVSDKENNKISEINGNLIFKQPNKFSLSSNYPNEELVLSNGETLWWFQQLTKNLFISFYFDTLLLENK